MGVAGRVLDRHHLARQPLPFLGREQQRLNRAADLVVRVGDREAGFGDDALDEVLPALFDQRRRVVEDLVTALAVETLAFERASGAVHRAVHLLAGRARDLADLPAGELVVDGRGFIAVDPGAVEEQRCLPRGRPGI